ncbi:HNH endonuclease signature motif containing protein [Myceligenerans crystallogenes]
MVRVPDQPGVGDLAQAVAEVAEAEARVGAASASLMAAIERCRRIADRVSRDVLVDVEAASTATRAQGRRGTPEEWMAQLARRGLAAELGAVLQVSTQTAGGLLADAEILAGTGARVLAELARGRISLQHARAMASQLAGLEPDVAELVTDEVLSPPVVGGTEGGAPGDLEDPNGGQDPDAAGSPERPGNVFAGGVLSPGQVRRRARISRERHHREPLRARCEKRADQRYVRLDPAGDGMAYLEAFLPAVTAHAIDDRLQRTARQARAHGDPRTHTQLRADTLADLVLADADDAAHAATTTSADLLLAGPGDPPDAADGALPVSRDGVLPGTPRGEAALVCRVHHHGNDHSNDHGDGPGTDDGCQDVSISGNAPLAEEAGAHGHVLDADPRAGCVPLVPLARAIRPVVHVTVPLLRLAGLDGHERLDPGAGPAMLDGQVPIDDATAARLVAQAPSLRRLLTLPENGAVVSVGRDSYAVPADLRAWLATRDVTCRWPGCAARADRCDIDHVTDWAAGGRTDHDNLMHLCRAHHVLKHQTRWTTRLEPDGTTTWTSPTGRTYTTRPQQLVTAAEATEAAETKETPRQILERYGLPATDPADQAHHREKAEAKAKARAARARAAQARAAKAHPARETEIARRAETAQRAETATGAEIARETQIAEPVEPARTGPTGTETAQTDAVRTDATSPHPPDHSRPNGPIPF